MSKHRLKPNYDKNQNMEALIRKVVDYYGEPYDDRLPCSYDHVSLRQVASHFNMSVLKVRKILITAGHYSIEQSRMVLQYREAGDSVEAIMAKTGLSKASVQSYLPYTKNIYNLEEKSVGADRIERWRRRKR